MKPPLSYVPLLPVLIAFVAGLLIADSGLSTLWVAATAIFAVVAFFRGNGITAICLVAVSIGWLDFSIQSPKPIAEKFVTDNHTHTAVVQSVAESETSRHLIVEIDGIGRCRLTSPSVFPIIEAGDIVTFTSTLSPPQNDHDLPDEWDIETFMYHQGIVATAYLQPEKISITGRDDSPLWTIREFQSDIMALIGASRLNDATSEFLIATISGDDSLLDQETRQTFTSAGLAHILALSGLHVSLIALIISILLFPLTLTLHNRSRIAITIILLWFYAIMTGLSPSVTRAVIMTTIYLIGLILQRRHSSMNAMCCAALIILLFDPMSIYSVGFQLTFVAVATILLFTNRLNQVSPRHKALYYLTSLATLSCAAMLGTGIIAAYYFHNFPIYFIIGNILVILLLPFLMGGGVLLVMLEAVGCDPQWLCATLDFIYYVISTISQFAASLPGANLSGIYFPSWVMIPYFGALISLLCALTYRRPVWIAGTIALTATTIMLHYAAKPQYPTREVYIPRDTYYTNIIARDSTTMYLFTTAHPNRRDEAVDRVKTQYRDYIARRNVDTVIVVEDTFNSEIISRRGRNIIANNRHYIVIDNDTDVYSQSPRPQYALVCRGFRGDIINLYKTIAPDTIILSNDLHPKRSERYLNECAEASIPAISLRKNRSHTRRL